MFRNLFMGAARNLARNGLYTSITVLGLAIGFAAALLIALYVCHEISYDRFFPEYERIYRVSARTVVPGKEPIVTDATFPEVAPEMKLQFPAIAAIVRLIDEKRSLRYRNTEAPEKIYWSDPELFSVLPLPMLAGDAATALQRPDSIVITRRIARKYFGREEPIGEVLELDRTHSLRVTAVLEDLPSNTHLDTEILASGRASFSATAKFDAPENRGRLQPRAAFTYLRLAPGTSVASFYKAYQDFAIKRYGAQHSHSTSLFTRIDDIHLQKAPGRGREMRPRSDRRTLYAISAVGLLIILAAATNFINLMTARSAVRAKEVGVRKAAGASRFHLVIQFIGETIILTMIAMALAMLLAHLLLPAFSAFLRQEIGWTLLNGPQFLLLGALLALMVGTLAGLYPALVLSAFRPVTVLKSDVIQPAGSGKIREILVVVQFAISMSLIVATAVIYLQTRYALNEGTRIDKDLVLVLKTHCEGALKAEIKALPGIISAACSFNAPFSNGVIIADSNREGDLVYFSQSAIDFGFFELYSLHPLAGRFFSATRDQDARNITRDSTTAPSVVINETAVRAFGFKSPADAVGQSIVWRRMVSIDNIELTRRLPSQIIGVAPDFPMGTIRTPVEPTLYFIDTSLTENLNLKLTGRQIPETLAAIDQLWKRFGEAGPIDRFFLDEHFQNLYVSMTRQAEVFAAFSMIALFIALLGLFGLSAFTAHRRMKEIGIRKVMGANRAHIVWLVVSRFLLPIAIASVLAWPLSYVFMTDWLRAFAYRIDMPLWLFPCATLAAAAIACATVFPQAIKMASRRPAQSLRVE